MTRSRDGSVARAFRVLQCCSEPYVSIDNIMNDHITPIVYVRYISDTAQRYPRATMLLRDSFRELYSQDSVVKTTVDGRSTSALRWPSCSTDAPLTPLLSVSHILDDRTPSLQKENTIRQHSTTTSTAHHGSSLVEGVEK